MTGSGAAHDRRTKEFQVDNKTVIVSGAAGGIGAVACRRFCAAGAAVIGVDIADDAGKRLADELLEASLDFEYMHADVSDTDQVAAVRDRVATRWSGLDVLMNNAGRVLGKHLLDTSVAEWDAVHDVTLKGAFKMTRALAPLMNDGGSIVNIVSSAATVGYANMVAYCAAKGGLLLLTKASAMDLAPRLRVNAICPGTIDTPMPRAYADTATPEGLAVWESYKEGHLLGRVGEPHEVVSMAMYLASDEASFVTGASFPVDGGWTAR